MTTVTIDARFNGPPTSANGGYACGCIGVAIDGAAAVRLEAPPPLDTPLARRTEENGVGLYNADVRIAFAQPADLTWNAPEPPSVATARAASKGFSGFDHHAFPTCFGCGPDRAKGDGLRLFPGTVDGRDFVACAWDPSAGDMIDGNVEPLVVWAALDCPSFFGLRAPFTNPFLLGQMTAAVEPALRGDRTYVVYGWSRGQKGRKWLAAAAIADDRGKVWGRAEHVWFDMAGR